MGVIIACVNQKGGVGKTATSHNEAYCFSQLGYKVLYGDLDPNPAGTGVFGETFKFNIIDILPDRNFDISKAIYPAKLKNKEDIKNLYIMPSHIDLAMIEGKLWTMAHREKLLKNHLDKIKGEFDFIFLDLPPSLGILSVVGIYAADKIIIPVKYEKDALSGVSSLFRTIREVKEKQEFEYMILKNARSGSKKFMGTFIDENLKDFEYAGKVFKTVINVCEEINKAKSDDCPVMVYAPNSIATENYLQLSHEIKEVFCK